MKALFTSVLIAVLGTLGCGSQGRFTAAELFPVQAGQSWHMVNQFGDVTTWSVEAVPANSSCETDGGRMLGLRITKDNPRTYWGLGIPEASDLWVLHQDPDGSWRSVQDTPSFPQSCPWCSGNTSATLDWRPIPGRPIVNTVIPAGISKGQTVGAPTAYHLYEAWQTTTLECIAAPSTDKGVQEGMLFQESLVMIDTPVYSGWGMLTDQHEQGVHEKWYFAPGIGLVEIQAYNINSNVLAITIKRTDK
jgi:hypothetical protein